MADVFDEVDEQLRSERLKTIALKSLPWVLAVAVIAVLAVGGVWGWRAYQENASSKASEAYSKAMTSFNGGDTAQAVTLWTEVSKSPSKAYKAMALMQLGGVKISDNKPAEAVKLFDEAADAAPDAIIADVARLKAAFALLDTAPYKEVETRLAPLTEEGRPYRAVAREALAFAKLRTGDLAGARSDFKVLTLLPGASEGVRGRAQAAIELIDSGSAKAVPEIARAAAALPPPQQLPPGVLPPGMTAPPAAPQPPANGTQ